VLSPINEIGVFSFKVGLQPNRRKDENTRVKKLSTLKDTNYNWSNVQLLQHLLRCKIAKTLVFLPSLIPAVGQSKVDKHLAALMRLILKLILFHFVRHETNVLLQSLFSSELPRLQIHLMIPLLTLLDTRNPQ
jgi:hypothetical protein